MENNDNKMLRTKVAGLESRLDMLESELSYLNELLRRCGFPGGIDTLKSTVEDLLAEGIDLGQEEKNRPFEGF